MRKLAMIAAVLLLASGSSFAGDDKTTVRGCLMQMGEDFILTDANGTKYEIDEMNAKLKDHLGHVVAIQGEMEGRSDDDKHEARKVDAKKIKMVAEDCSSFNVAKTGAAGATTTTTTTTTTAGTVESDRDGEARVDADVNAAGAQVTTNAGDRATMGKKREVRGCVTQVDDQFVLTEEGTGATYRLDGEHDKLRQHVNHTVALKGEAEELGEVSGSGAKFEFDVEEVSMISAGCSAKPNAAPQGVEKN